MRQSYRRHNFQKKCPKLLHNSKKCSIFAQEFSKGAFSPIIGTNSVPNSMPNTNPEPMENQCTTNRAPIILHPFLTHSSHILYSLIAHSSLSIPSHFTLSSFFLGKFPPPFPHFRPNWINDFWRIQGLIHFADKHYFEATPHSTHLVAYAQHFPRLPHEVGAESEILQTHQISFCNCLSVALGRIVRR